jgi:hypothetical protein
METIQGHGDAGRFIYLFNLLCQRLYSGGVLEPLRGEADAIGAKIGDFAYVKDGTWVELPALSLDYCNGYVPYGSRAFSAFGCDFYLFRGIALSPEEKKPKEEGTFRVKNDAFYLAQLTANAWRKLGGTAKHERDLQALVCVGAGDIWVSLYA